MLAIDLYGGLGGWAEGLLAEGWAVIGFDIERHEYGAHRYPAQLVLQDVRTIHGSRFRDADLIVASPPCQEYSYMAMPWSRAKTIAEEYRDGTRDRKKLTELFDACFRIQREASEAAGRHIPMVVENVCGAQKWVGKARWHYGSFYLWGDVPALMPMASRRGMKGSVGTINGSGKFREQSSWDHVASAMIAKIPLALSQYIARVFKGALCALVVLTCAGCGSTERARDRAIERSTREPSATREDPKELTPRQREALRRICPF